MELFKAAQAKITNETVGINMTTADSIVALMKVTNTGNIEFPNARSVDVEIVKIYDEIMSKITEAHVVFKIKLIEPITASKPECR